MVVYGLCMLFKYLEPSLLHPQRVKTFSEYAVAESLRDDGFGVDDFYCREDAVRFVLARQHDEYVDVMLRIPAFAWNDGHSAVDFVVNHVGYLLVFFRNDDELHCLARAVNHIVAHVAVYQGECDAVDNRLHFLENEV